MHFLYLLVLVLQLLICDYFQQQIFKFTLFPLSSGCQVKRQLLPRAAAQRAFPLSRSRQFPPPEELEESEEYVNSEDEEEDKSAASPFRGRRPQKPPDEEEYSEDYSYTEAPKKTTPTPPKPTSRTVIFNNRYLKTQLNYFNTIKVAMTSSSSLKSTIIGAVRIP